MIIFPDDWRSLTILGVIAAILLVICAVFTDATKPTCPDGSIAQHTRSGWFCTVPKVKP